MTTTVPTDAEIWKVRAENARLAREYVPTLTVAGMVNDLHTLYHNATAGRPGANSYLIRAGLARINRSTGWCDATPAGRELIAAGIHDGTIDHCPACADLGVSRIRH